MLYDKIQEFINNTECELASGEYGMFIIRTKRQKFVSNMNDYYISIDIRNRILYDTYSWDTYEEIGIYKSDEDLLKALSCIINKIEIVLFVRKEGACSFYKYTSTISNYINILDEAKMDLAQQGFTILAAEFYCLKHVESIIYDDTFSYRDVICCLNSIYDMLIKKYEDSKPYEMIRFKNSKTMYARSIITEHINWERALAIDKEGYSNPFFITVGVENACIGNIFASMYIMAYPSDERAIAASPKLLESIKEKVDKKFIDWENALKK